MGDDGTNDVLIFQAGDDVVMADEDDENKGFKDLNLSSTVSEGGPKIIRPNLKFKREKEKSVVHMLERMDDSAVVDMNQLEEPSLIEIEKIIRWLLKYNATAFDKRKVRPTALF